jgi:hypothetical protein
MTALSSKRKNPACSSTRGGLFKQKTLAVARVSSVGKFLPSDAILACFGDRAKPQFKHFRRSQGETLTFVPLGLYQSLV